MTIALWVAREVAATFNLRPSSAPHDPPNVVKFYATMAVLGFVIGATVVRTAAHSRIVEPAAETKLAEASQPSPPIGAAPAMG
jgi:hypothetical protein